MAASLEGLCSYALHSFDACKQYNVELVLIKHKEDTADEIIICSISQPIL